jgi:hypothetical protein
VQQAVNTQHKLIVAHEVTTLRNDHASLQPMSSQAKQALGVESLTVVADRGYMNGEQSDKCEACRITPVVPMNAVTQTHDPECYPKSMFRYEETTDTYRCPAGELLRRYKRDRQKRVDFYWTAACESCPTKALCTGAKRRTITRSWFAAAAERAAARARERPQLMRLRSATAEHPFGNLKAMMPGGFSVRTLPKVRGEMALAVLTYNLKRTANILGSTRLSKELRAARTFGRA